MSGGQASDNSNMYLQIVQQNSDLPKSERVHCDNKQSFATIDSGFPGFEELSLRLSKNSFTQFLQIGAGQNLEVEKLVLRA